MTGVDIHALSGAYALDAIDDLERAELHRHLSQCPACALEVAELRETTARLADASAIAPPPQLRAKVLAEIARTRQVGPAKADGDRRTGAGTRWRRWVAGAVAAGVLALAAGATTYAVQERRAQDARLIQSVLAAPDAVVRSVAVPGGGELTVCVSESRDAQVVMLSGLVAPDPAHAYQLWLMRGDVPTDAGVLAAGRGTGGRLVRGAGGAIAVTLEPAGGSAAPTTDVLTSVPLA